MPLAARGETVTSTQTQTATSKAFTSPLGKEEPGKKKRIRQGNVPISRRPVEPDRDSSSTPCSNNFRRLPCIISPIATASCTPKTSI